MKSNTTLILLTCLTMFLLIGCSTSENSSSEVVNYEISNEYLQSTVPFGYMIYDIYSYNLDKDLENEYVVLYQESIDYSNSDRVDLPRTLPVIVSVQDYRFGEWQTSKMLKVMNDGAYEQLSYEYQYLDIPRGLDSPIEFHQYDDRNLFSVYSYNGSFDGKVSTVTIFEFDEFNGLEDLAYDERLLSTHGVTHIEDRSYFVYCNWTDSDLINNLPLVIRWIDFGGDDFLLGEDTYPETSCSDVLENDTAGDIDLGEFLYNRGITL